MANGREKGKENGAGQDRPLSEGWSGGEELPIASIEQPDASSDIEQKGLADIEDVPLPSLEMSKENPSVTEGPSAQSKGTSQTD